MAQLFVQETSLVWSVLDLTDDVYRLSPPATPPTVDTQAAASVASPRSPVIVRDRVGRLTQEGALLVRNARGGPSRRPAESLTSSMEWVVLAGANTRLRINGVRIAVGVAALRHRDELVLEGSAPLYFSSERLARVETYEHEDAPRCPRCTHPIEKGQDFVACPSPSCNRLHHQLVGRECWTYGATCALCDQSTDLEAGFRFSPEGL